VLFTGEYEHSIDSKQRLAIPSDIRARMEREKLSPAFYLVNGPNGVLWLWPEATFESMAAALDQTLLPGEDVLEFDELTFPFARRVEMDSAGRIRLPDEMITAGGLGSNVIILGVRDHLELRDPSTWSRQRDEKRSRQREILLRARQALASKVGPSLRHHQHPPDRAGESGS
jgi:MraZ protein